MTAHEEIRTFVDFYLAAGNAADADALLSCYADDVVVMDAIGGWRKTGVDSFAGDVRMWLSQCTPGGASRVEDLQIVAGQDVAVAHGLVIFAMRMADGTLTSQWNRWTVGLQRREGRWLIVHEHTSLPLDGETAEPITRPDGR